MALSTSKGSNLKSGFLLRKQSRGVPQLGVSPEVSHILAKYPPQVPRKLLGYNPKVPRKLLGYNPKVPHEMVGQRHHNHMRHYYKFIYLFIYLLFLFC